MSAAPPVEHFDVCGPLPAGVTLLEASAGTGKTFAIAALATRLVAEGTPLSRLLLVTFTRMATGELRERVRARLVSAERGLARVLAGGGVPADDQVLALLASGTDEDRRLRQRRLADAVAGFDAATIATTHGFCQHVLAGLGIAGDVERDATFVEDLSDLVQEVVDDLYVRRFHELGNAPFGLAEARRIGRAAIENPLAPLLPEVRTEDEAQETWAMRRRLADAVRREVARRKLAAGVLTYDDLLTRLRETLVDPVTGADACARLRQRYAVALVDEFQDTDPIQWEILRAAFGDGEATLVLIGDPKQAIYSFRGADVYAYLDAAASATTTATLATNWRSDQGLIDAYDALFAGARLGHEGIVHRPVEAAAPNREPRLAGAPSATPLRFRVLHRDDGLVPLTRGGMAEKPPSEALIARDLAADVVALLASPATLVERAQEGTEPPPERVEPRHVAVLVPTNRQAKLVREALERTGVPAVVNGAGSVFGSPAATAWLRFLEALERPASGRRAHAAALTPFLGWSAAEVAGADEHAWEGVHARLHGWGRLLRQRGVAALLERASASEELPRRLLGLADGERELTDIRHVGQLLHEAATDQQLGAASLTGWLRQRIADAGRDAANEDRALRLDSDAEAVQVLTIHRSKGLEFPVVYLPYAWQAGYIDGEQPPTFHDPANGYVRTIDVGRDGPDGAPHVLLHREEQRGEDLRLLYVALTRAKHQAVVWWAGTAGSSDSPLGRLLFARDDDGNVAALLRRPLDDDEVADRLRALVAAVPGRIAVERLGAPPDARWTAGAHQPVELSASPFERTLDARWGRASYSAIVAASADRHVASEPEPEAEVIADEPLTAGAAAEAAGAPAADEARLRAAPLPLGAMPGGADVGDLIHRVLEAADFAAPDLERELATRVREQRHRRDVPIGDQEAAVAGLQAALETPLGPLAANLRLRDVARRDRLDEVGFELPLVGGDRPSGTLLLDDVAALLEAHLPPGDPLAGYPERLRDPSLRRQLRGYLTGTLDLVLRVPGAGGEPRFAVVDYKTNWLGVEGEELSAWHYRPAAIAEAMLRAHYPLQALLYLVALHRYLRWRLPGYAPDRQLAGALYLFLRGMTGADTPLAGGARCGVYAWQPPAALIEALSDLLDRGSTA